MLVRKQVWRITHIVKVNKYYLVVYRLLSVFCCPVSALVWSSLESKELHTILNFSKLIVTVNRPENQSHDSS
jgi:hypothetical protein